LRGSRLRIRRRLLHGSLPRRSARRGRAWLRSTRLWRCRLRLRRCRLWRGLRDLLQHRAALLHALIRPQNQSKRTHHEHDGAPRGGPRQNRGRSAWTECCLAPRAAKRTGDIGGLAALQQHNDDQEQAINHEKRGQQKGKP